MKIEDLRPDQMVSLALLVLIVLSILVLSVLSVVYLSVRIAKKQRFSVAKEPLATVGFIDCIHIIGLVMFLIITAQAVMLKIDPSLRPAEPLSPVDKEVNTAKFEASGFAAISSDPIGASIARSDLDAVKRVPLSESISEAIKPSTEGDDASKSEADSEEHLQDTSTDAGSGHKSSNVILSAVGASMQLLSVFLVYLFIRVRTGCSSKQLGLNWNNFVRDVGIGLWVLFLTLPVLLVLSAIVSHFTKVDYSHPVIDMMKQDPWSVGFVAWMAVIVAPISEEFFFRTMLIGMFESVHYGRTGRSFFLGWMPRKEPVTPMSALASSLQQTAPEKGVLSAGDGGVREFSPPWWPAILSGILFGVAHFSYGVSWIPLVLFGVVLGRVYQLRQSLVTCITIHLVFNAINLLNLWLSLDLPKP